MGVFEYTAQNSEGKVISGSIESSSRSTAISTISRQGLRPISVNEQSKRSLKNIKIGGDKVKSTDLVVFTRQLSTMVSAGVPLIRALNSLAQQSESDTLKDVVGKIVKEVESGAQLGDSMAKHPKVFSDVYINMVRAGETAGILDDILKRLATQQEKNDSMRKKVKSAMTYPMVLIVITIGAFFGLMFFVIPQIGDILYELGGPDAELPMITQAMLAISGAMLKFWYIVFGGIAGLIFAARWYLNTPKGKSQFHHLVLKIPAVGPIVSKVATARFARTFASLVGAGVSILEALHVTGKAIGNAAFQEVLDQSATDIKAGMQLSESIEKSGLFPAIVPQMLAVGEETGETSKILVKVADFYEEEVDAAISSISSILEPVMIVVMGGMVGLIAVSVMGPIASLSQSM